MARNLGYLAVTALFVWGALQQSWFLSALALGLLLLVHSTRTQDNHPIGEDTLEPVEATVHLPLEDFIDLHTFAPKDIPSVVDSYIESAVEAGFAEVRLIHGKGKGVQRSRVRATLRTLDAVESFGDAPPGRGGWGATIAILSKPRWQK